MKRKIALFFGSILLALSVQGCNLISKNASNPTNPSPNINPPVQSDDLTITSTHAFIDNYGTYHVVGDVVNNSSVAVSSVELTVEIKDGSGNSLLKDESGNPIQGTIVMPMLFTIEPSEHSPFSYSYDMASGTPDSYSVNITGMQAGEVNHADLTADHVQLVDDGSGWYYLSGELVNLGSQWVHVNNLAGAVVNSSNQVLSADLTATYVTELAPAGDPNGLDRTPFQINFPNPGEGSNWSLYWDADVTENVISYPMDVKITNTYFDETGSAHIVGWVTNQSNQPLSTLLVAGLYADDQTALDASYGFTPVVMMPGKLVPFSISSFGSVDFNQSQASRVSKYSVQPDPWFTSTPYSQTVELAAFDGTVTLEGTAWTFRGSVNNTSGSILSSITVVALVMDENGNLMASENTTIYPTGEDIKTGDTNNFQVKVNLDPKVDFSKYSATVMITGEVK